MFSLCGILGGSGLRKGIVRAGISVIIVGSVVFLIGSVLTDYLSYYWGRALFFRFVIHVGWFLVFLGLAIAFLGIVSDPKPTRPQAVPQFSPAYPPAQGLEQKPSARYCVMCGREIPLDAVVCPYCRHDYEK